MNARSWRLAASIGVYVAISAVIGRDVLAHLATHVANDPGDPLLTAGILHWNATHVPWTDAWYQLPIFYPTRDTMTFSEHLLGLSVVAAPIEWLTGNPLVTYNLTLLLTFVLSAIAMYALVWRLTGSAGAAFVAGLAYGFAPYRISQLPHVQMLAAFYAPIALLGLHAYLETGRRRWLALYGGAWLLQAAANGYMLVFFSVLVGLWVLWFVVARRRWTALAMIALATVIAVLPLAPILLRYIRVHEYHGFVRSLDEIKFFSADMSAVLCAPPALTFWGWIRVGCRPEGELFPGVALFVLCVVAAFRVIGWRSGVMASASRPVRILTRLMIAVGVVYGLVALSVWIHGPWRIELGPLRASATSATKATLVSLCSLLIALALPPGARLAARRSSTTAFYLLAAVLSWLLALGPRIRVMDESIGYDGPFAWLMFLPGVDGLRVPARFWLVTIICLCIVAGLLIAELLKGKSRRVTGIIVTVLALAILGDGWVSKIPALPAPPGAPNPALLRGRTVLELPIDDFRDIAAGYRAMTGGWHGVNGYSGFGPSYYYILRDAAMEHVDVVFYPLQAMGELDVLVPVEDADDQMLVRRQPGMRVMAEDAHFTQFRLPARPEPSRTGGSRVAIESIDSRCGTATLPNALDGDPKTRWVCGPGTEQEQLTIDLGRPQAIGAVLHGEGMFVADFPRKLTIETSADGQSWLPAWSANAWGVAVEGAMRDPKSLRIRFPFEPREARYVRLTHPAQERDYYWALADLEVWSK